MARLGQLVWMAQLPVTLEIVMVECFCGTCVGLIFCGKGNHERHNPLAKCERFGDRKNVSSMLIIFDVH